MQVLFSKNDVGGKRRSEDPDRVARVKRWGANERHGYSSKVQMAQCVRMVLLFSTKMSFQVRQRSESFWNARVTGTGQLRKQASVGQQATNAIRARRRKSHDIGGLPVAELK